MAAVQGFDSVATIVVIILTALFVAWVFQSVRFQFKLRDIFFLVAFALLLGVFLESYFRGTEDLVLSIIALAVLMLGWILIRIRGAFKGSKQAAVVLIVLGASLFAPLLMSEPATAYKTEMHPDLLDAAFNTLDNDGKVRTVELFTAEDTNGETLWSWVSSGIVDCDRLDLARNHYYDPDTGEGLSALDAKQLCEEQYAQAVEYWQNGNYENAAYFLGRAVHLVQDLTLPHHASLQVLDGHSEYEAWLLANEALYWASTDADYSYADDPGEFVEKNAISASALYDLVQISNASDANYRSVALTQVPLAIKTTAAFIEMFADDVVAMDPMLYVSSPSNTEAELSWSPSADPDFLEYRVYVSDPGVALDDDDDYMAIKERSDNALIVNGMRSFGVYEFRVVTVLSDGTSFESNIAQETLGYSMYLFLGIVLSLGILIVILIACSGKPHNGRRRN